MLNLRNAKRLKTATLQMATTVVRLRMNFLDCYITYISGSISTFEIIYHLSNLSARLSDLRNENEVTRTCSLEYTGK